MLCVCSGGGGGGGKGKGISYASLVNPSGFFRLSGNYIRNSFVSW